MPTALVTGANGFIGSHLVEHLQARGWQPFAMVRRTSNLDNLSEAHPEYRYADLRDEDSLAAAMDGVEVVFHVAGILRAFSPAPLNAVNGGGAGRVLRAAERAGVRRVVLVSSLEGAGPSVGDVPRSEAHKPTPFTWYGTSKHLGELEAWKAAQRGQIEVTVVRPPLVYGPRDTDVLQMIQSAIMGVVANPGFYEAPLSAVHPRDLCRGIALAAEKGQTLPVGTTGHVLDGGGQAAATRPSPTDPAGQGIYYFTDGGRHSVISFGHAAAAAGGRRAITVKIPRPIAAFAGWANEALGRARGSAPAYNTDKVRASFASGWWADHARATAELGYEPQVPLQRGLEETVRWYRERRIL